MSSYLSVRRDDIEVNQRTQEYENVIRIPNEEKKKSSSFINKIVYVILILAIVLLIFQFGFISKGKNQKINQAQYQGGQKNKDRHKIQEKIIPLKKKDGDQDIKKEETVAENTEKQDPKQNENFSQKEIQQQRNVISKDQEANNNYRDQNEQGIRRNEIDGEIELSEGEHKKGNIRGNNTQKGDKLKGKSENKFISTKTINEDTILWGHYKSHLIYNISQRKNNPLSLSMSYLAQMNYNNIHTLYKQKANLPSVLYDFKYNDGIRFSDFSIDDQRYDFKVESVFIKQKADKDIQKWVNQHKILKSNDNLTPNRQNRSLFFSISKEIYDKTIQYQEGQYYHFQFQVNEDSISIDVFALLQNKKSLMNEPGSKFLGSFVFTIQKENNLLKGDELKGLIKYSQLYLPKIEKNWDIKGIIHDNLQGYGNTLNGAEQYGETTVNFILLQFIFEQTNDYIVSISYNSAKKSHEQKLPSKYPFSRSLGILIQQYESQLHSSIESKGIQDNHNCTVFALSNLLGGMTYKFGELQYTQRKEQERSTPKPIFSFTPSRTRFGWSFLWDDGFHNAVASKFQPKLSAFVIKSWLDSMNEDGWICREQSRGDEAFGLCDCPAFIRKDNRDGNPPTLILALEYFIRDHYDFMKEGYFEKIEKWYHWYLKSQMVKDDTFTGNEKDFTDFQLNSFVFKYWDENSQTASMNSGLDDYPRNDNNKQYFEPIGHIDAQSWMYHFTTVLENLSLFIQNIDKLEYYQKIKNTIKERTEEYFLDEKDLLYKDIISSKRSLRSIDYSPHFGYPNLLPLAFGLVKDDEYQLPAVINKIKNPNILWTNYGLRSLSKSDTYFGRGNNYWTGPIWIQMNYLVLRGLKLYYPQSEIGTQLYKELRKNVMNVVCSNWEKTGYFYENYNKNENGQGSDAYPFTGWTATVALVNAENY